ncbi:MAG: histidine--tRNA ligase, partial [Candidatus Omnitrophica bacterium]|nr:histidine--tRNA ligase [Candidatus Omnitrophota bacterium]
MFKRIPGTRDILPQESSQWQALENLARRVFGLYAYQEIRTPLLEDAGLYNRSLGESTEIVQKQMFLVHNKEDLYALRPEGTASILRAYIENNLDKSAGLSRLYYMGPMFRLERPQKGRLRQFHHIGAEVIGSTEPQVDIEVISLSMGLLDAWGVKGSELLVNSLGCAKDRKNLMQMLGGSLKSRLHELCDDCKIRVENNVLRVLDCKQEMCRKIVAGLEVGQKHLCGDCNAHFSKVLAGLRHLGIPFSVEPMLVRWLDYYTRTVFEIKHKSLGAQDAIGAGGRYDGLSVELSGPQTGAMGFAF